MSFVGKHYFGQCGTCGTQAKLFGAFVDSGPECRTCFIAGEIKQEELGFGMNRSEWFEWAEANEEPLPDHIK